MSIRRLATLAALLCTAGTAAAADLAPEPAPIDYVRVCDAFGTGFLVVPGSNTCARIMGRVRAEYRVFGSDEAFGGPGWYSNSQPGYVFRTRAYLYSESRTDTEFGLLRTYSEIWLTEDNGSLGFFMHNAQIEIGGLKAGRTASFYDLAFGETYDTVYKLAGLGNPDFATNLIGYKAAFGDGFSAALSLEDAVDHESNVWINGKTRTGAKPKMPDIVGKLSLEKEWGAAQVMGALHQVRTARGGGEQDLGYAVGGGAVFKLPMLGERDRISIQGSYADGALLYLAQTMRGPFVADGVWTRARGLELATGWALGASAVHFWTPELSSAIGASYVDVYAPSPATSTSNLDLQANLVWYPVKGLQFGTEVEWKRVTPTRGEVENGLVGLLRVQRDF